MWSDAIVDLALNRINLGFSHQESRFRSYLAILTCFLLKKPNNKPNQTFPPQTLLSIAVLYQSSSVQPYALHYKLCQFWSQLWLSWAWGFKSSFTPWPSLPSLSEAPIIRIPSHMHPILITSWASQFSHTPMYAFYTVWITSFQTDVTFPLSISIHATIMGKRHHKHGEAFIKNRWCIPNASAELLLEHTLLWHWWEPSHYSHKLGHFESEEFCAVMIHQNKYQHKCLFQLVKAAQGSCLQVHLACLR